MLLKPFFWLVLKLIGWRTEGKVPKDIPKYVIIVAPHTSNYDFIIGVCVRPFIRATNCGFLIKSAYMKPPFGFLFRWLGGIAVERDRTKKTTRIVDQVAEAFAKKKRIGVAVTPEGTRSYAAEWKSGFYRIAQATQVPLALGYIDYRKKVAGIGDVFYPTGDYEKDLADIQELFRKVTPFDPKKSNLDPFPQKGENRIKHYSKIVLRWVLLLVVVYLMWHIKSVSYGLKLIPGQFSVVWQAKPVEQFLEDEAYPDSLKRKIRLVSEIKAYAFDSIGLDEMSNYSRMYDQKGKALVWAVTASERFALKPHRWCFPIVGCFPYRGYFSQEKAKALESTLDTTRFDTGIREVSAWSTLGWLSDPILSNMLYRSEGSLANLVIHELTHGTLFIKGGIEYNENLANFVGDEGATRFLEHKYGRDSPELDRYLNNKVGS